jgi:hypothetical protein
MACNWICPVTRYHVMSPYKFLLPSDDRQNARGDIYRLVLVLELAYRFLEARNSVLVDIVNGRWRCWRMTEWRVLLPKSPGHRELKYWPGLKELTLFGLVQCSSLQAFGEEGCRFLHLQYLFTNSKMLEALFDRFPLRLQFPPTLSWRGPRWGLLDIFLCFVSWFSSDNATVGFSTFSLSHIESTDQTSNGLKCISCFIVHVYILVLFASPLV